MQRYLVVNADDFGYSQGVNRGIVEAHEHGIVTSASFMVRKPGAADAALYSRGSSTLDVGLHIDLGEWIFRDDKWHPLYEFVDLGDRGAVHKEVREQISAFLDLVGRAPTHLDSHQNIHIRDPVRAIVLRYGQELGVPVRHFSSHIRHCGGFYGQTAEGVPLPQAISVQALTRLLSGIAPGITELGCHPGYGSELDSVYASERDKEIRTLCDPRIRECLTTLGITPTAFHMVAALKR
jgi:chitin disaccharide deacetylase